MSDYSANQITAAIEALKGMKTVPLKPDDIFSLVIAIREQLIAGKSLAIAVTFGEPRGGLEALERYERADKLLDQWLIEVSRRDSESAT